jgi:hypothetical protein
MLVNIAFVPIVVGILSCYTVASPLAFAAPFGQQHYHHPSPIANAGPSQIVNEGTIVTLDGRGSYAPDRTATIVSFLWQQIGGNSRVNMIGANTATPTFFAPSVPGYTILTFMLSVGDNTGATSTVPSSVNIFIKKNEPSIITNNFGLQPNAISPYSQPYHLPYPPPNNIPYSSNNPYINPNSLYQNELQPKTQQQQQLQPKTQQQQQLQPKTQQQQQLQPQTQQQQQLQPQSLAPSFANSTSPTLAVNAHKVSTSTIALPTNIIAAAFKPLGQFSGQSQVDLYKKYVDSLDTITTFSPSNIVASYMKLLPGSKTIEVSDITAEINQIAIWKGGMYTVIAFNNEGTCPNAITTIQQAAQLAHSNGFKFIPVPGVPCDTPADLTAYAKVSDMFILQTEGQVWRGATGWKDWVTSHVSAIRQGNPNIPVILELSVMTNTGYNHVAYLEQLYASVASQVNGIHVWFSNNHPGELQMVDQILLWFVLHYG